MSLFEQITDQIKAAMLARDSVKLETLRGIKKELLEAKTAKGGSGDVSDEQALGIINKLLKQRKESAAIYQQNGRNELAEKELAEAAVLEAFLPKQLSAEELLPIVKAKIAETGITDAKMAGKLTGMLVKELAGKADGKLIGEVIRSVLQ